MRETTGSIGGRLARVRLPSEPSKGPAGAPAAAREAVARWRLVVARDAAGPDSGQRGQVALWEAALIASGLPMAGLDTARARPRFATGAPLAPTIPGERELVDVWLVERLPRWRVRESLTPVLPPGHRLVDLYDVWLGEAALPGRVSASVYRASLAGGTTDAAVLRTAAGALLDERTIQRVRHRGDATIPYDLRPFIAQIQVVDREDGPVIRMVLRHDPEKGIGRPDELLSALGERLGGELQVASLVRESLVLGEPPAPPVVASGRPGGRSATRRRPDAAPGR
jgi:Uncharacterized protein conserved in bacteria (DUF2344)